MTRTVRFGVLAAGAVAVMMVGTFPLGAQEAKPSPKAESAGRPAAKRSSDTSRRVPPFFGQLGLTPEQREEIYTIRRKHQEKIDALTKQLADIQAEMLTECETVLDDTQKQMLETRRNARRPATKARASAAAARTRSRRARTRPRRPSERRRGLEWMPPSPWLRLAASAGAALFPSREDFPAHLRLALGADEPLLQP